MEAMAILSLVKPELHMFTEGNNKNATPAAMREEGKSKASVFARVHKLTKLSNDKYKLQSQ